VTSNSRSQQSLTYQTAVSFSDSRPLLGFLLYPLQLRVGGRGLDDYQNQTQPTGWKTQTSRSGTSLLHGT
jgi:hypothetical protein